MISGEYKSYSTTVMCGNVWPSNFPQSIEYSTRNKIGAPLLDPPFKTDLAHKRKAFCQHYNYAVIKPLEAKIQLISRELFSGQVHQFLFPVLWQDFGKHKEYKLQMSMLFFLFFHLTSNPSLDLIYRKYVESFIEIKYFILQSKSSGPLETDLAGRISCTV